MVTSVVPSIRTVATQLNRQIAIDVGSTQVRLQVLGKSAVHTLPAVVSQTKKDRKIIAIGQAAEQMIGKVPVEVDCIRPIVDGVIVDPLVGMQLLRLLLAQQLRTAFLLRPEAMLSVPGQSTQVERAATQIVALQAGARRVFLIPQPLAAAIGAGLPVAESTGHLVIHCGAYRTEAAVVSLGSILAQHTWWEGGAKLDEKLRRFFIKKYNFVVSPLVIQQKKTELRFDRKMKWTLQGQNLETSLPSEITVPVGEIWPVVQEFVQPFILLVHQLLANLPAGLTSDVLDKGLVLTGGTALLPGLAESLREHFEIPVTVAEEADLCVLKGTALALEHLSKYRQAIWNT